MGEGVGWGFRYLIFIKIRHVEIRKIFYSYGAKSGANFDLLRHHFIKKILNKIHQTVCEK